MSDLMSTTAIPAAPEFGTPAALAELIGNRWSYPQIAAAFNCTERAVYTLVDRYRIPYIKVIGKRYVEPNAIREAVLRDQANTPPRGRGRPPKVT